MAISVQQLLQTSLPNGYTGSAGRDGYTGSAGAASAIGYTGSVGNYSSKRITNLTDGNSVTFNVDTTDQANQNNTQATGILTVNAPTGTPNDGQQFMFALTSSTVQTFNWNAAFAGSGDLPLPPVSTGNGKTDYMGFVYNSTTSKWNLVAKNFGF